VCYTVQVMSTRFPWARRFGITGAFALGILLSATACGGGGEDATGDPATTGGQAETIIIKGWRFTPGNLQVPVGAAVTWMNEDSAVHDAKADDTSWETENLRKGASATIAFDEPGEYSYYCTLHPSMKARITVTDE